MVSLDEDASRRTGHFFEERKDEDDSLTESTTISLVVNNDPKSRKINTTVIIILEILLLIIVWVSCFVVPVLCSNKDCHHSEFSIVLYILGGVWYLQLIADRFYRNEHYRSRLSGYLNFYRRTRNIRRLPLIIASMGTSCLLIVSQILNNVCPDKNSCGPLQNVAYLQIIISILSAVQILILVVYLVRTMAFNRSGASPDVTQSELMTSFHQTNSIPSDIGFKDDNRLDEVLEKQADMIRYLRHHYELLNRKALALSQENQELKRR